MSYALDASDAAKVDGTNWCSPLNNALGSSTITLEATKGFDGSTKCTWILKPTDGTRAPAFKVTSASVVDFYLGYLEWYDLDTLGTNQLLPRTSGTEYYLGNYPDTTGEMVSFPLNPI